MSIEIAVGHFMTLSAGPEYYFQNFYLNETVGTPGNPDAEYAFLPFGFSGVTVNRAGDNVQAEIVLPNTAPTRDWAVQAIEESWVAGVQSWILSPDPLRLFRYVGQISAGGWDQTSLVLELNSVLDAVGTDFPQRTIDEQLVGHIPSISRVRV